MAKLQLGQAFCSRFLDLVNGVPTGVPVLLHLGNLARHQT